jgi:hypothetical protein
MMRLTNLCSACKHLRKDKTTCDAFPDGVPDGIIKFGEDHREPVPGDQGIVFEKRPGADAEYNYQAWLASHNGQN